MKKIINIVLSLIMAMTILTGVDVSNSYASTVISKTGADGITWTLDSDGTLTLSGSGRMSDIESGYADETGYHYGWTEDEYYENMKWHHNYKSSIKRIVVEPGITRIGQYAFYGCSNVSSISIPEGVDIGAYAFANCPKLTAVSIPNNVRFLGLDWNINATCYAFKDCSGLKTLIIGDNVDLSTQAAFMDCSALSDLTIGRGSIISSTAFKNDSAITSLTIDTATVWEYNAFGWCQNISTVNITGTGSFDCVVHDGNGYRPWVNSNKVSTVTVAEGVTNLDQGLFYNAKMLTNVALPDSLTTIGNYCFYNCTQLDSIVIPKKVTSIGANAFENVDATFYVYKDSYADTYFTNLGKTISYIDADPTIVDPGAIIDSREGWVFYESGLLEIMPGGENFNGSALWWQYRDQITEIHIMPGVSVIQMDSFSGFRNLKKVTLPNSLKRIEDSAFSECRSLENITIPNSVTSIGSNAFNLCESLTEIDIPDSVTSLGERAFSWCNSLKNVTISNGETSIGDEAFILCESLTSITIPNGVKSIGHNAFSECCNLTDINIQGSVTSIGDEAFSACRSLKKFAVPNGVTSIGNNAFYLCESLTEIDIQGSMMSIGEGAFSACSSLKKIVIPDAISIGDEAFIWCESLTSITIPDSVTSIGHNAFSGCWHLKRITIPISVISIEKDSFGSIDVIDEPIGYAVFSVDENSYAHTYVKNSGSRYDLFSGHQWEHIINKASLTHNGNEFDKCSTCKSKKNTKTIYYPKTFKLSTTAYTYSGTAKKPAVTVKNSAGKTLATTSYSVKYSSNTKVGKATVKVTLKAPRYTGTKTLTFKINPKGTSISKLTKKKKGFTVKWKKQATQTTGYQIQYSTSSKFASGNKLVTVGKTRTTSKTISKLKAKKTYYVRVRTYKTVSGVKYYSAWSAKKYVKTK